MTTGIPVLATPSGLFVDVLVTFAVVVLAAQLLKLFVDVLVTTEVWRRAVALQKGQEKTDDPPPPDVDRQGGGV